MCPSLSGATERGRTCLLLLSSPSTSPAGAPTLLCCSLLSKRPHGRLSLLTATTGRAVAPLPALYFTPIYFREIYMTGRLEITIHVEQQFFLKKSIFADFHGAVFMVTIPYSLREKAFLESQCKSPDPRVISKASDNVVVQPTQGIVSMPFT